MNRWMDTHVWEWVELEFVSAVCYANPFLEIELQAEFLGPNGEKLLIPGFWDGGASWKVRFAPTVVGEWKWKSVCSNIEDNELHGKAGMVMASPWSAKDLEDNANRRGFIKVHSTGRFFEYGDRTPFYWLGDTLWSAHTLRCDLEEGLPKYLKDRKEKGFSVIQLVAGHPTGDRQTEDWGSYVNYSPEQYLNEGGAPYLHRYDRINPRYFNCLDKRINLMTDMGFVACIFGMWGQELKGMKGSAAKLYLRYIIARYAAFNVIWSPAGEYLFTWDVQAWRELGEDMDDYDPYKHPTSAHSVAPHSGSQHYQSESWYDFNMIQVGHVLAFKNFMETLPFRDYQLKPVKPVIMSESWYENHPNRLLEDGNWINDRDIRFAVYVSLLQGCTGQTYGAHGVWSFYNGEEGDKWHDDERPDMWFNDLSLPGSTQMKYLRELMETLEWWNLEPHPEWVSTLAENSIYCAAVPNKQYAVYSVGGKTSVPVLVIITDGEGKVFEGKWFNPRTGEWTKAMGEYHAYGCGWMWRAFTPDHEDWILALKRK